MLIHQIISHVSAKNTKNNTYTLKNDKKNLVINMTNDEFKKLLEYTNFETNINIDEIK